MLWCHSHLIWLVFEGWFLRVPSPRVLVFIQKTFCDLFLMFVCLFLYFFLSFFRSFFLSFLSYLFIYIYLFIYLGIVKEERWEGRLRGKYMLCKVQKYRTNTLNENVRLNIKLLFVRHQSIGIYGI